MPETTVYLALGANLGDRQSNIERALQRLGASPGVEVLRVSNLRETDPVDAPPPRFLNGVAELAVDLPAAALHALCRQVEREAGRDHDAQRNAPRLLDLDILLFGDAVIDTRELIVPHPRMFDREFVMQPLAELIDVAALSANRADRPRVFREPDEFAACCSTWSRGSCSQGLVPTMGALHEGHASLVRAARAECDRVAVTIFVNPLQFAAGEDLDDYPRTFETDLALLRELGADVVFAPRISDMYPDGFASHVRVGAEACGMEGATRPSHFEGVTTVVAKLFNLARPTRAYFGQKDAQQVAVIGRMVRDLAFPLDLRICPVVREPDGLAMSSRNRFLEPADRRAAAALSAALRAAREAFAEGERAPQRLLATARSVIEAEPRLRLDYLELRADPDLKELADGSHVDTPRDTPRMLIAAYLGDVRLIDNMSLVESS